MKMESSTSNDEMESKEGTSGNNSVDGSVRRMALNDTKAGMKGLDVEKINQIITEASKGSKYYVHQQKAQEKLNIRLESIRQSFKSLTEAQIERSTSQVDSVARKLESRRVLSRTCIHVDMDAFYAAVETRDNPDLRDKPMAVGGDSMLSTSNYLARRFGVRAAMPGFMGKKLCPELIIVPCNFEKYTKVSQEVQEVFKEYDPNFSSVSLDEAYLDITDYLEQLNADQTDSQARTPEEVTNEIREKIFLKTGLTASAGIAANSLLAKICGDINKPNGQYYLPPSVEAIKEFMNPLPIRKVSGIGNVTEQMLNALNIYTCKDLWEHRGVINLLFKPATSSFLLEVAMGVGNSMFCIDKDEGSDHRKSIGSERTFYAGGPHEPQMLCKDICQELEESLQSRDLKIRSVTLKIKTVDFEVKTRNVNLLDYTNDADIIFETAWGIYKSYLKEIKNLSIRLLGVRLSNFQSTNEDSNDVHHDDVPIKALKQKRIDHLIMKIKETETSEDHQLLKHECPFCKCKFKFYKQLEEHVENCLTSAHDTSPTELVVSDNNCDKPSGSKTGTNNISLPPPSDDNNDNPFMSPTSKCPTCSNTFPSKTEREIGDYFDHVDLCRIYSHNKNDTKQQQLGNKSLLNKQSQAHLNSPPRKRQKQNSSSRKITDFMKVVTNDDENN